MIIFYDLVQCKLSFGIMHSTSLRYTTSGETLLGMYSSMDLYGHTSGDKSTSMNRTKV